MSLSSNKQNISVEYTTLESRIGKDSGYNSFVGFASSSSFCNESDHLQQPFRRQSKNRNSGSFNHLYHDPFDLDNQIQAPLELSGIATPFKKIAPRFYHSTTSATKKRLIFAEKNQPNLSCFDDGGPSIKQRSRFCNGVDRLDVIALLEHFPMIENILQLMSSRELQTMSFVSQRWRKIVFSSRKASKRLHHFQMERIGSKENLSKSTSYICNTKYSKYFSFSNRKNESDVAVDADGPNRSSLHHETSFQDDFTANQKVVKTLHNNEHLVKCPRCSKGSKILHVADDLNSEDIKSKSLNGLHVLKKNTSFEHVHNNSKTQTQIIANSDNYNQNMFRRFFSVDSQIQNLSHFQNENNAYGECTGRTCNYRFCLECSGTYHPGEKCNLSELRTPSKIKLTTKSKKPSRSNIKLKRTALKRLCF